MSDAKETKLARKMRARAGADGLAPDHPLYLSAAVLDVAADVYKRQKPSNP